MASFFGVNVFLSPVGQKIEQATESSLPSESWELNMEICDMINETEEASKDAIKAIRKRLTTRNFTVVMYTLTVLETCIKNCGRRFHILVCNKDFLQDLIKIIGPKNDPPIAVQEKVLSLIQSWADAFRNVPELGAVVNFYQDLKQKVDFPMTDLDSMAPIHTPQRAHIDEVATAVVSPPPQDAPGQLTTAQMAKLTNDLQVVEGNMTVLGEMLSELLPGKEDPSDLQLLQELRATCQEMQKRLMELINQLSNDQVTAELLRINDALNNLFLRYTRYEKKRTGTKEASGDNAQLIDLTESGDVKDSGVSKLMEGVSLSTQLSSIPTVTASNNKDDEFDMFAQSRKASYQSSKTVGSTYEANQETVPSGSLAASAQARGHSNLEVHSERDFDEMEEWLGEKPKDTLSSSEFERFLSERAAAAECLPSPTHVSSTVTSNSTRSKKTEDEAMFAL